MDGWVGGEGWMSDREMGGWVDADVPGRWGPLARRPPQSFVLKMCSVCGHSAEGPPPGQGCREEAGRAVVLSAMMGPCRACGAGSLGGAVERETGPAGAGAQLPGPPYAVGRS